MAPADITSVWHTDVICRQEKRNQLRMQLTQLEEQRVRETEESQLELSKCRQSAAQHKLQLDELKRWVIETNYDTGRCCWLVGICGTFHPDKNTCFNRTVERWTLCCVCKCKDVFYMADLFTRLCWLSNISDASKRENFKDHCTVF